MPPTLNTLFHAHVADGFTVPLHNVEQQVLPTELIFEEIEPLMNIGQSSYLIDVSIGSQGFQVTFDTGSSDLWIVSSNCTSSDCADIEKYQPTLDLNLTSTPFELRYLSGSASGIVAFENFTIGEFSDPKQVFALVNETNSLGLSAVGNSGILGLAFPAEASIPATIGEPLLHNIFSSLEPSQQFFAYGLSREQKGSTFSLGQTDPAVSARSGDFKYFPVFPSSINFTYDFWKLPFLSISVGDENLTLSSSKISFSDSPIAVLDTGTTLILGPTTEVSAFWNLVGDASLGADGLWRLGCDRIPDLSFVLGNDTANATFALNPADVVWLAAGGIDGQCLGGIQSNDDVVSGDWLFGASFLRNVYVTHHKGNTSTPPLIGLLGLADASAPPYIYGLAFVCALLYLAGYIVLQEKKPSQQLLTTLNK